MRPLLIRLSSWRDCLQGDPYIYDRRQTHYHTSKVHYTTYTRGANDYGFLPSTKNQPSV